MHVRIGRKGLPRAATCRVEQTLAASITSRRVSFRRAITRTCTGQPRPCRFGVLTVRALKNYSSTVNEKGIVVGFSPPCHPTACTSSILSLDM